MAEKVKIINNSNRSVTIGDDTLRFNLQEEKPRRSKNTKKRKL